MAVRFGTGLLTSGLVMIVLGVFPKGDPKKSSLNLRFNTPKACAAAICSIILTFLFSWLWRLSTRSDMNMVCVCWLWWPVRTAAGKQTDCYGPLEVVGARASSNGRRCVVIIM